MRDEKHNYQIEDLETPKLLAKVIEILNEDRLNKVYDIYWRSDDYPEDENRRINDTSKQRIRFYSKVPILYMNQRFSIFLRENIIWIILFFISAAYLGKFVRLSSFHITDLFLREE